MSKDPYKNSPYDAAGMPLAAETVDYDNKDEVAKHMVKDKVVEPVSLANIEFDTSVTEKEWQKRTKYDPAKNNTAIGKVLESNEVKDFDKEAKEETKTEETKTEEDDLLKLLKDNDNA